MLSVDLVNMLNMAVKGACYLICIIPSLVLRKLDKISGIPLLPSNLSSDDRKQDRKFEVDGTNRVQRQRVE